MKFKIAAASLLFSAVAGAESYNTLIDLSHANQDDFDSTSISAIHYFESKETIGPLDQFSFINSNSLFSAGYQNSDFSDSYSVGGEWHNDNGLFLGAGYLNLDVDGPFANAGSFKSYRGSIGYQASEKWSVEATYTDPEGGDSSVSFHGRYKHQLSGQDYLGFTYSTNDDTDYHRLGAKYFSVLDNGQYLVLDASYTDYEHGHEDWSIGGAWYFNEKTSLFANVGDDDAYRIGAKHYFNSNWAISAAYADSDIQTDGTWMANLRAQF